MTTDRTPPASKSVTIRGQTFASGKEAAEHFGTTPTTVSYYRIRDRLDEVGLRPPVHDGSERPVTIRGVVYPSRKAAAKAFGVAVSAISHAIRRGTLDNVGSRPRKNSSRR